MAKDEIMAIVVDIIRDVFDDPDLIVTDATNASMVAQWDSTAQINILMAVEEQFAIELSSREMDGLQNVGDLVAAIERHTSRGAR